MPQPPATGCYRWTIIHTKAATLPVAGRDGRLWITGSDGAVYSTMPSEQGGAGASLEWTRIDPPADRVAGKVALDHEGTVYLVAASSTTSGAGLFRLIGFSGSGQWEDMHMVLPGTTIFPTIDEDDVLWVGGEWGQVARFQSGQWSREILPLPYHLRHIWMTRAGHGWALAETRSLNCLCYRDGREWHVVEEPAGSRGFLHLLFADENECFLQDGARHSKCRSLRSPRQ